MLSPMDGNIPPPSTPPSKKRRVDAHNTTLLPSFDEEPHSSPQKLGELGIHVLFSPKNHTPRGDRVVQAARSLAFTRSDTTKTETSDDVQVKSKATADSTSEDELEYWDRPRESMYVTAFNTAVNTVIEREGHLFSPQEMEIINTYRNLPCTPSTCSN